MKIQINLIQKDGYKIIQSRMIMDLLIFHLLLEVEIVLDNIWR